MPEVKGLHDVFAEDLKQIASDENIPWRDFRARTVFVTGATGLIGGALVRALSFANAEQDLNMRLIAHGRNGALGAALAEACGLAFVAGDIREPLPAEAFPPVIDYIFHCAAITASADMAAKPADVIATALDGTRNALKLAKDRHCRAFVFLSSMEVYGSIDPRSAFVTEDMFGTLDLKAARSSYPESKRMCECLCAAYAAQYGVPVKIARPARTFGAGTPNNKADTRVAMQFAGKVLAGEDIELHTAGTSVINCCYTADAVRGLLTVLLKGSDGEAYNITHPDACMTVREMAELVANELGDGKIKVVVKAPEDIQKRGYAPHVGYRLSADKLKALGWTPKYGLADMYGRMLADWRGQ
jgi:nucleoside-diphosphate-sugar epimerase